MPKKVSDLTLKNRSELTDAYQVVVTDPTDYKLYRCSVPNFRGASVFTSENEPTTNPENPLYPEYIAGDIYIQETSEGKVLYDWDNLNKVWINQTKLNGIRVLTASDFPDEINLDLRTTNFTTSKAYSNDYYLNKVANLLYQYSPTQGFQFGSTSFEGYQAFRAPEVWSFQGKDVTGYLDLIAYISDHLINSTDTDENKRKLYHPIHQDSFHVSLENDEGHGGWFWDFNSTNSVGAFQEYYNCFALKVGIDPTTPESVDASSILVRKHWREAKTWNQPDVPVQNDKKYRQGDNVFVTEKGIIYYDYQEGLPDGTTDLGELFVGQTTLKGSSLLNALDTGGNWVSPTSNDADYTEGDFILTRNLGTPRIHGPYKFGAATDLEAWPLYAVLRQSTTHQYDFDALETSGFNIADTFAGDYPTHTYNTVETMIVDGDQLLLNYTDDKAYILRDSVSVDMENKQMNWGDFEKRINLHPVTIQTSGSVSAPSVDASLYYNGAIVRNKNGDLFKFNENFLDHAASTFTSLDGLRSNVTHVVETTSGQYVPPTDNGNAAWGSATVIDGDTLEVRCTAADADKVVLFTADVNEATDEITWRDRRSKYGVRTKFLENALDGAANGFGSLDVDFKPLIQLTEGDFIIGGNGGKYIYREDYDGGFTDVRFEFVSWDRHHEVYLASGNSIPANLLDPIGYADYCIVFRGNTTEVVMPKIGDIIRFEYTKPDGVTKTGKVIEKRCTAERPYAFGDWENPNVVQYWAESVVGRNNRDDIVYSAGDFMDNSSTGWRYGPYVEGAADNATAWPDFVELKTTTTYTDATTTLDWKILVDDNEFYFEEQ